MKTGNYEPDNLIAGDFPRVTGWLEIPAGTLRRGTVLTSGGAAMESGGEPHAVLAEDADASAEAVQAPVFLTGEFALRHLILDGGAEPAAEDVAALRSLSIFAKETVPAA